MGKYNPLISILMAVYEPRMDWLRIQLTSLNQQTYPNLRLYICDDCSPTVSFDDIKALASECITSFSYIVEHNKRNLGSNGTFERLTREAEGEYFAYCDQDDEWLPEKLTVLQETIDQEQALLVCSDMYVIDGDGNKVAGSITEMRRHHKFQSGIELASQLLIRNWVTGCTMLIVAEAARKAAPFCPYMVHDHYLALWCAERGKVLSLPHKLICYRIHGGNQTGLMTGVYDKKSYGQVRIVSVLKRMEWLSINFPCKPETKWLIEKAIYWAQARSRSWDHQGGGITVWKYRQFSSLVSVAELLLKYVPERIFMAAIHLAKKNQI